jgi:hypothetical protein
MTEFVDDDRGLLQTIHADLKQIVIPYLKLLIKQGAEMSTALDDLRAAESALAADVLAAVTLIQALQAAAPGAVADADVEAVVASLTALHAKLSAAAPTPPPLPQPPMPPVAAGP